MDERPVRREISLLLAAAALAPLLLAGWSTQASPSGRPLSQNKKPSPLALVQYSVNLRELPATDVVPAHFTFWNRGRGQMEITKLEPSCGCLGPVLEHRKSLYQPGEEGRFIVSVKTANEPVGPSVQTVKIHYTESGQAREQLVTFRYVVPNKKVSVSPSQLNFFQLQGEEGVQELRVLDSRRANLQVLAAKSNDAALELEVGEREITRDGIPATTVRVKVLGPVPPGRRISTVTIKTDDPAYPEIRVPVVIQGPTELQLTSGTQEKVPEGHAAREVNALR